MTSYIIGTTLSNIILYNIKILTQNIYNIIGYINHNPDIKLKEELMELDIEFKIKIVELLLNNINTDKIMVKLCLNGLSDCLSLIEKELINIKNKLKYNNSLYIFYNWRKYEFQSNMNILKILNTILMNRQKLLFDLINIKC